MASALNSAVTGADSSAADSSPGQQAFNRLAFAGLAEAGLTEAELAEGSHITKGGHRLYRDVTEKEPGIRRRDSLILGVLVVGLHIAAVEGYIHMDKTPALQRPQKNEVIVEFVKPEIIPPPKIEPPKPVPPPPQPKVQKAAPPKPAPALRTPVATQDIAPEDMTVKENTQGQRSTEPVVAEPPAPPVPPAPPPPKEEPVTEATGFAGYLKNPAPDYPAVAQRQGWEGKVVLKVRVLANGTASSVEVKQSSGRKVLDDAAIAAVKGWTFSPSKRGSTPIDGWATVPIEFKNTQ